MKILFLSLLDFSTLEEQNIYTDLLKEFKIHGHEIYAISPVERRKKIRTHLIKEDGVTIVKQRILNIQKTNYIEKGIATILLETQIKLGIKKYFSEIKFDIVLYPTPPITFQKAISFVKMRDNATTYLMLKDIFPQSAVDLGVLSDTGIKSIMYKFFRKREKRLYKISDHIGCMSQANVDYIVKNNNYIDKTSVHVLPNSIIPTNRRSFNRDTVRADFGIPKGKIVFVYGGNLGKPQGIPFLIRCLRANSKRADCYFVICGTGTEYLLLKEFIEKDKPQNVLLINGLPKEKYEEFILACDVGMIFLDYRFTVPNVPSRLLSYLDKSMPVLACTDLSTDIKQIILKNSFGWWCESNSVENFTNCIDQICCSITELEQLGINGNEYLNRNLTVEISYEIILSRIIKQTL